MKVWTNRFIERNNMIWKVDAGRSLEVFNNTKRHGRCFDNVYLGYKKMGRKHIISLNINKKERKPVEKVVGVWISDTDYTVITTGEIWTGKAKDRQVIIGRFGIYNTGTIINCQGTYWILTEDRGWVVHNYELQRV